MKATCGGQKCDRYAHKSSERNNCESTRTSQSYEKLPVSSIDDNITQFVTCLCISSDLFFDHDGQRAPTMTATDRQHSCY